MSRTSSLCFVTVLVLSAAACAGDDDEAGTEVSTTAVVPTTTPAQPTTSAAPVSTTPRTTSCGDPLELTDDEVVGFEHDGIEREYIVDLPAGFDNGEPAPLLFDFHGFGGSHETQRVTSNFGELATARGYVVIAPQGEPLRVASETAGGVDTANIDGLAFWNIFGSGGVSLGSDLEDLDDIDADEIGADDIGFVDALLDSTLASVCIDEQRVYASGMSNGAGMSTALACELGDRFAAVAPVSGVNLTGDCAGTGPTSVLAIHGDADQVASYEGNYLLGFELGNPSVPDRLDQLATVMGCGSEPEVDAAAGQTETRWTACEGDAQVVLVTVHGGGHSWGDGKDTSRMILDFFDAA